MSELRIPEGKRALSRRAIRAMKPGTWVQVVWSDADPEWGIFIGMDSPIHPIPEVVFFRPKPRYKLPQSFTETVNFDQIVDERPLVGPNFVEPSEASQTH